MTRDQEAHIKRMLEYAKQHVKKLDRTEPLTPEELASVLIQLKKKYPDHLPKHDR
jgi:hypothetical protein